MERKYLKSIQWGSHMVRIGDKGTFFGHEDGPGTAVRQVKGTITHLFETENFGWMVVKPDNGNPSILKN